MKVKKSYYFKQVKFIRDLAHDYINVTKFQLELIDTVPFQRLKDIRQLTCQQVYPCARHTRFEHSLGVMELTRRAINNLNKNNFFASEKGKQNIKPISENNQFNVEIAALLHDVGHCPFSHLGEIEFNKTNVWESFKKAVENKLPHTSLFLEISNKKKPAGAVHEQLSCIMILEKYYDQLTNLESHIKTDENDVIDLTIDLELIVRCIIGCEYKEKSLENEEKNLLIRMINSSIFDMDKLDYIIRDSIYTGIGTPIIDTQRLFKNMYVTEQYTLLFTSKAVPALQNMIEARDNLYMYVYNHHTAVISDFLSSYIQRRMSHNARDFVSLLDKNKLEIALDKEENSLQFQELGIVSKEHLFSKDAVIKYRRSDSDWLSLINRISYFSNEKYKESVAIKTQLEKKLNDVKSKQISVYLELDNTEDINQLVIGIQRVYKIINRYQNRSFLKPWWKTIFEFSNFINKNFLDDIIRKQLCELICDESNVGSELRSQIAKHVSYIANKTLENEFEKLDDGDFFVVQRSVRFLDLNKIETLDIALKSNEIIGTPTEADRQLQEYYIKKLTNIIPQKDFYSFYDENSFYIYSKPLDANKYTTNDCKKYYKKLEEIFVFVAIELLRNGKDEFEKKFVNESYEEESKMNMLERYQKATII